MADEPLRDALLEFLSSLSQVGVPIFLGGGYGLYLKQLELLSAQTRTYLPIDAWPQPRSTADLDMFLPTEVIVEHQHMVHIRTALDKLGYKAVPAEFMHFEKDVSAGRVRIELLTGPIPVELQGKVKINGSRVRPRKKIELHAFHAEEAIAFADEPVRIVLDGTAVLIPNAFSFLLMKLHAFRDRKEDADKDLGRHHALDVYRLIAMLTEPEERLVREMMGRYRDTDAAKAAVQIVADDFRTQTSIGALRIREHSLAGENLQVDKAIELLNDLFGTPG